MKYPIWLKNMLFLMRLSGTTASDIVYVVNLVGGAALLWLDRTKVKGNPQAQRIVNHFYAKLSRIADFSLLLKDSIAKRLYIRLRGLAEPLA